MLPIFVDTNVLIHSHEWKISLDEAVNKLNLPKYKLVLHPLVFEEVMNASNEGGKLGMQAKIALQMAAHFGEYLDENEYTGTDTALLESTKRENGILFTFDKELRTRCRDESIPVIFMKKPGKLMLFGYVK